MSILDEIYSITFKGDYYNIDILIKKAVEEGKDPEVIISKV